MKKSRLGAFVAGHMAAKGTKPEEMSKAIGCTDDMLSDYMSGAASPDADMMGRMAAHLGVEPDALKAICEMDDGDDAEMSKLGQLALAVTGQKTVDAAHGTLLAFKDAHGQVPPLTATIAELRKGSTGDKRATVLAQAVKDGKITPAQAGSAPFAAGHNTSLSLASLEAYVASAPRIVPERHEAPAQTTETLSAAHDTVQHTGGTPPGAPTRVKTLTKADRDLAAIMGNDPTKLAQDKVDLVEARRL